MTDSHPKASGDIPLISSRDRVCSSVTPTHLITVTQAENSPATVGEGSDLVARKRKRAYALLEVRAEPQRFSRLPTNSTVAYVLIERRRSLQDPVLQRIAKLLYDDLTKPQAEICRYVG